MLLGSVSSSKQEEVVIDLVVVFLGSVVTAILGLGFRVDGTRRRSCSSSRGRVRPRTGTSSVEMIVT